MNTEQKIEDEAKSQSTFIRPTVEELVRSPDRKAEDASFSAGGSAEDVVRAIRSKTEG